jgi:hypothetical protein
MSFGEKVCSGAATCGSENVRRRLADERRGHFARVEVEPDGEQHDEYDEADQRPEKSVHYASFVSCAFALRRMR